MENATGLQAQTTPNEVRGRRPTTLQTTSDGVPTNEVRGRRGANTQATPTDGATNEVRGRKPKVPTAKATVVDDVTNELPGRKVTNTSSIPTAEPAHVHCEPCEFGGKLSKAIGYCRDCFEHLCRGCYDGHKRPKLFRNHVLVLLDTSKSASANVPDNSSTDSKQTTSSKPVTPLLDVSNMKLTQYSKINITTKSDSETSFISGLQVLSDGTILCMDNKNYSIKKVNTTTHCITSCLRLCCSPWNAACLPDHQVAITLPFKEMIVIVNTKADLSTVRELRIQGRCRGIYYTDHRLVITYDDPAKVEVLTLTGDVLHRIEHDDSGQALFKYPWYVTTQRAGSETFIYVSDMDTETITKMTMSGKIISQYHQRRRGFWPSGIIALGNGKLAVCNFLAGTIDLLNDGGAEMTLVKTWQCVASPYALALSPTRDTLYVSSSYSDDRKFLHVYKLTPE